MSDVGLRDGMRALDIDVRRLGTEARLIWRMRSRQHTPREWLPAIVRSASPTGLRRLQRTVIVAMIPVGVVQVAVDQIVDMIAVWHRLVPASRTVRVCAVMAAALVTGRAPVRIGRRHLDRVLIHVILVHVVQMAVVEVVDVIAMANGSMPAPRAVLVRVVGVLRAGAHW
jgi:hypothetical protein